MSFSEKVAAFSHSASNALYNFGVGAKETFIKIGASISDTSRKVYAAVLPHFQRFKEISLKFFQENKTGIGLVAIGLGIGATIGAAITYLVKGKSQEPSPEKGKDPKAPKLVVPKPPTGGFKVIPDEKPGTLKKTEEPKANPTGGLVLGKV